MLCSSEQSTLASRPSSPGHDYVSFHFARQVPVVASGGLGCEVFVWDLEAATRPVARAPSEPVAGSPAPAPVAGLASSLHVAPSLARTTSASGAALLSGSLHGPGERALLLGGVAGCKRRLS